MQTSLPYSLAVPSFPFRHLAALAGRAAIGGTREVALACFMVARVASLAGMDPQDDPAARTLRATAARAWVGTLALPPAVRAPVLRCAETSATGTRGAVARDLEAVIAAAASFLDNPARHDLELLVASLMDPGASQAVT